jgi:hypothetical protein
MFANQKSQVGYVWEGLRMENVGIPFDRLGYLTAILVYFMAILYTYFMAIWKFCGHLEYVFPFFGTLCQKKYCNPARNNKWREM